MKIGNQITKFISKCINRSTWYYYVAKTIIRQKIWSLLYSKRLDAEIANSLLYYKEIQPVIPLNDPIFTDNYFVSLKKYKKPSEYLLVLKKKSIIEPDYGYAIADKFSLLHVSLPGSEITKDLKELAYFSGIPFLLKFFISRGRSIPVRKEKSVVNLRYIYETNYFHFYTNLMSSIKILDDNGIDQKTPIILSKKIGENKNYCSILNMGKLKEREWIIQDNFYIETEELIVPKTQIGNATNLNYFLDLINVPKNNVVTKRIFLTRSATSGRNIRNIHEIETLVTEYGFEVVNTEFMDIENQIALFNQAQFVIGIHGAGLINIIFSRQAKLKLLEIFPPYIHMAGLDYYRLTKMFNFSYDFIIGKDATNLTRHSSFYLDPEELRVKLNKDFGQQ